MPWLCSSGTPSPWPDGGTFPAFDLVWPFDDLDVHGGHDRPDRVLKHRPLIASIGVKLYQEREHAEQRRHQHGSAIAVLNVGGVNNGVEHQALGVYQDVPLLAFDFLASIVAMLIDAEPPFSALFTL